MKIKYNQQTIKVIDEFVEVGYNAEKIFVDNSIGIKMQIGGQHPKKEVQVFLSLPHDDENFVEDALRLDAFLASATVPLRSFVIFKDKPPYFDEIRAKFKALIPLFDVYDEFGVLYGTKIESDFLENNLAKAIFIVGKDGAIYFEQMPSNMADSFDLNKIALELNKAAQAYTGVGCHG